MIIRRVRKDGAYYAGPFFWRTGEENAETDERYLAIRNCTIPIDGKRPVRACSTTPMLGPKTETTFEAYQEAARDVKLKEKDLSFLSNDSRHAYEAVDRLFEMAGHYRTRFKP